MAITFNKVGIEIEGKVYHFYKLSFGFQRKLVEIQSNLNKRTNEIAKKYEVDASEVSTSPKVPEENKLELARLGIEIQEAISSLFVNPDEAKILDNFDGDNIAELIEALK